MSTIYSSCTISSLVLNLEDGLFRVIVLKNDSDSPVFRVTEAIILADIVLLRVAEALTARLTRFNEGFD